MERILINGIRHLICNDAPGVFENESYFGLNVGDKVKQIGERKITPKNKTGITSSNRVHVFTEYAEYCGVTFQPCGDNENAKALAFRIKDSEIKGLEPNQYLYTLFFCGIDELLLPDLKYASVLIYKPKFILFNPEEK